MALLSNIKTNMEISSNQCWSGKKRGTKVFNWSEVHFYRSTSYKTHTLISLLLYEIGYLSDKENYHIMLKNVLLLYRLQFFSNPFVGVSCFDHQQVRRTQKWSMDIILFHRVCSFIFDFFHLNHGFIWFPWRWVELNTT